VTARRPHRTEGVTLLLEIVWAEESCPVHSQARLPAIKPELRRPGTEADPSWDAPQKELERFLFPYLEIERLQIGRITSGAGRSVGPTSQQDDITEAPINCPNLPAAEQSTPLPVQRHCMGPSTQDATTRAGCRRACDAFRPHEARASVIDRCQ
jgi:hypothetical protein